MKTNTHINTKTEREAILEKNWEDIVQARKMLADAQNGTGQALSLATQKNIEETIEKMLLQRKKIIAENNKTENYNTNKPIILGNNTKNQIFELLPKNTAHQLTNISANDLVYDEIPNIEEENKSETIEAVNVMPQKITANIANVTKNLHELANKNATERLYREYSDANIFKKGFSFFTRRKKLKKYKDEEIQKFHNQGMFDEETANIRENAARRFFLAKEKLNDEYVEIKNVFSSKELNILAKQFINEEITKQEFQKEFESILILNNVNISEDFDILGTDILPTLENQKAFHSWLKNLPNDVNSILKEMQNFANISFLQNTISQYLNMNFALEKEKIANILSNENIREQILNQDIEIEVNVLAGGNAAYEIRDINKKNGIYYAGEFLQKHPILSSIASVFGISTATLAAGPIGNMIFGSSLIGATSGLRRYSEYSDAHTDFEKRIVRGEEKDAEIFQNIEKIKNELQNAKGIKKIWKTRQLKKAQEKIEWYQKHGKNRIGTTHRRIVSISSLNNKLLAYIEEKSGFELDSQKRKDAFYFWLVHAVARLDAWKQTGHNFLKSNNSNDIEADFALLYENVSNAQRKIWVNIDTLRKDENYEKILQKLTEDYNDANTRFKQTRNRISLNQGLKSGVIYGASSIVFQWLAGTGMFAKKENLQSVLSIAEISPNTTNATIEKTLHSVNKTLDVDINIADKLEKLLGSEKYNVFVQSISESNNPNTLWETLIRDVFENKNIGNEVKNEIMTFVLNATDVQNGVTKPELLIEASKQWLFWDIANDSNRIEKSFSLLQKWWYKNIDHTWLLDSLKNLDSGKATISDFSSKQQTQIAEFLWTYVHRNGQSAGSPLWEVFVDSISNQNTLNTSNDTVQNFVSDQTKDISSNTWKKFAVIGIPTWKNTFLSALRKSEEKNTKTPIEDSRFDEVENDNIILSRSGKIKFF